MESAARNSGLNVHVLMISTFLDLYDNSTCYLHQSFTNITFFTISLKDVFVETPLEKIYQRNEFLQSYYKTIHLSDLLRVALIYKVGGFYSDLDSVTLNNLRYMKNVVGSTLKNSTTTFHHIPNGVFQFSKNHELLLHYMNNINSTFSGQVFNEIGPPLLTETFKSFFNISHVEHFFNVNASVLPSHFFFPAKSYQVFDGKSEGLLWTRNMMSSDDWKQWLKYSYMIHFYSSQSSDIIVQDDINHEAYAYVAPRYCPISYQSSKNF